MDRLIKILQNVAKNGFKKGKFNMEIIIQAKKDVLNLIPNRKECNPGYNQCVEDTYISLEGESYEK